MNYKVLYIFTDRLVFYSSSDPGSATLEPDSDPEIQEQESKIERIINFGEIILDCGKIKNKLCHAVEYPGIYSIESFKLVSQTIKKRPDSLCILIPFFENGYQKMHEKIAYICGTEIADLYNIITFKQYLSRQIELYQLKVSLDKYNGFNGLLRKQFNVVVSTKEGNKPALAKVFNKGISFSTIDVYREFIKYFSFYELRKHSFNAQKVSEGLSKKKIPDTWSKGITSALPECCIYLNGELDKITFCLANNKGEMEESVDICKTKLDKVFEEIKIALRGIRFSENFHEIQTNKLKAGKCESQEFLHFKNRAEKTGENSITMDCKLVMNYVDSDEIEKKIEWCKKNYQDELNLELKLMSLNDEKVFEAINTCVYQYPKYAKIFSDKHFDGN